MRKSKKCLHQFGLVLACACMCLSLSGCNSASADESQKEKSEVSETVASASVNEPVIVQSEVSESVTPANNDKVEEQSEWGEFEGFINGSDSAVVDEKVNLGYDDFEAENVGKSFTFEELNDYMANSGYAPHTPDIYAYFMAKEGGNLLLLKYDGMDIYDPGDDSFVIFAISAKKDGFHITYDVESWCRNEVKINSAGIIDSWGSSGAGDHGADRGYLDGQGLYNRIFFVEECSSGWIGDMFMYYGDVAFSEDTINNAYKVDGEENLVSLYRMDGQVYGTIEYSDTDASSALVESATTDGVIWVDASEIDGLIAACEEKEGLSDTSGAGEPEWILVTSSVVAE